MIVRGLEMKKKNLRDHLKKREEKVLKEMEHDLALKKVKECLSLKPTTI